MPIVLTFTEGGLPKSSKKETGKRISDAFLKWHGLSGNKEMPPNVTNHINVLPRGKKLRNFQIANCLASTSMPVPYTRWTVPGTSIVARMTNEQWGDAISKG